MEYNKNTPVDTTLVSSLPKEIRDKGESLKELIHGVETDFDAHLADDVAQGVHGMGSIASQDYTEGIWTPVIVGTTTAGTHTYTIQQGTYRRIGKFVFLTCLVQINSKDGNMAGDVRITGLPFVPSFSGFSAVNNTRLVTYPTGAISLSAQAVQFQNFINLIFNRSANTGLVLISDDVVNGWGINLAIAYPIA